MNSNRALNSWSVFAPVTPAGGDQSEKLHQYFEMDRYDEALDLFSFSVSNGFRLYLTRGWMWTASFGHLPITREKTGGTSMATKINGSAPSTFTRSVAVCCQC